MEASIERIEPRNASDAELEPVFRLRRELALEQWPEDGYFDFASFAARERSLQADAHRVWALAKVDGRLLGYASVGWRDIPENRHLVGASVGVHPQARREGLGRRLLAEAGAITEEQGRTVMISEVSSQVPAGAAFAQAIGAEQALEEHDNRLALADVDRGLLERWMQSDPAGYSVLVVDGVTPPELLAEAASVFNVMNDAPRGSLNLEDDQETAESVQGWEKAVAEAGHVQWTVYARHDESGRFAGFTRVSHHPSMPRVVDQWGTAVRPEDRGHGLGRLMKATMLDRILRELPEARTVRTTNALVNQWMLAINRELGFRPGGTVTHWQIEARAVRYTSGQPASLLE